MSEPQLKPCKFCGGTKVTVNTKAKGYFVKQANRRAGKDTSNYTCRCTRCGAKGPLKHTEAEAVGAWNTGPTIEQSSMVPAWQPIATAPSDETLILAACAPCGEFPEGRVMIWNGRLLATQDDRTPRHLRYPATMWMPVTVPDWKGTCS